jgi:hypothetical protein
MEAWPERDALGNLEHPPANLPCMLQSQPHPSRLRVGLETGVELALACYTSGKGRALFLETREDKITIDLGMPSLTGASVGSTVGQDSPSSISQAGNSQQFKRDKIQRFRV